jgi:hypothetical protein
VYLADALVILGCQVTRFISLWWFWFDPRRPERAPVILAGLGHSATTSSAVVPLFTNNSTLPRSTPSRLVDIQGLDSLVGNTNESPMNIQFTVPE